MSHLGSKPVSGKRTLARCLIRVFGDKRQRDPRRPATAQGEMPKRNLLDELKKVREMKRRKGL